jgi:putative two-component system response regulator
VKIANSGEKALKIAASDSPPDLILLDIMMPGMDGYEVCERLKHNPETTNIPVIFLTAKGEMADQKDGLELGAVDYITKPISVPIVLARVKTHLALYDQTRELERMVGQRTGELVASRGQIIRRLGRAAEFKDNETGNHVIRMSHYARLVGAAAGLGERALEILFAAAPMHDVGKLGVPDRILLKPGKLDADEWAIMKRHPAMGAEIIGEHDDDLLAAAHTIALTHHEKWDGGGYPAGLAGEAIPLAGRIVAVADVFDALLSERPYKPAHTVEDSLAYMNAEAGRQFDPALITALLQAMPEVLRIRSAFADERGALTDLAV